MAEKNICKFIPPSVQTGLTVSCFIFESNPDVMHQKQTLPYYRIFLIIKGDGCFYFDGKAFRFSAGNLLFGFKNEVFITENEGECEYMYIDFSGIRADELFKRFNISHINRVFSGFDGLIPLWKESLLRASESTVDLASESMLLYAFSRLSGYVSEKNSIINRITEISEEQFNDPELSVAAVAQRLGYNAKYVSHIFKEKMGLSYSEYLRTIRIKYAVSLFDHGIDSVKNVALLSGFGDPLYFSTVFKSSIGVSPKEYLNRNNTQK